MRIVTSIQSLNLDRSVSIGFVPTMGAFHEGHLSLMRIARAENACVVVSIFVNPTQFGQGEDFDRYPRSLERDALLAEDVGADVVFAPELSEMYPRMSPSAQASTISVPDVSRRWEGAHRPGHFDGVCTVVAKLFNIIRPGVAYFGLKDLQQCLVLKRMVEDLNMSTRLSFQDTVRESDGLAMSSRNAYLTPDERAIAPALYRELASFANPLPATSDDIEGRLRTSCGRLSNAGFDVDYLEIVDLDTMTSSRNLRGGAAIIAAAKLGKTRLIDNVVLTCDPLN